MRSSNYNSRLNEKFVRNKFSYIFERNFAYLTSFSHNTTHAMLHVMPIYH